MEPTLERVIDPQILAIIEDRLLHSEHDPAKTTFVAGDVSLNREEMMAAVYNYTEGKPDRLEVGEALYNEAMRYIQEEAEERQ